MFRIHPIFSILILTLLIACSEKEQELTSPSGGYQQVVLKDGTTVKLGPKSSVVYKPSSNQVKVDGEAILTVNPGNELTVVTPNGVLKAQSGNYRVHSRRTTMIAFVIDGQATASNVDGGATRELTNEMIAIYNGKNLAHWGEKNKEQMTNDKYWVFNSASVKFILEAISAQYSINFDEGDANLNKVFSGFVPRDDIQIALSILLRSIGLEYEDDSGTYYLKNRDYNLK